MKIKVSSSEHRFTIIVPTCLLFSKGFIQFGIQIGKKYSFEIPDISPKSIADFCKEIHRIKKTRGSWELINLHAKSGESVQVIL